MTIPEQSGGHEFNSRSLSSVPSATLSRPRSPLIITLSVLCAVLLATTIGFAITTLSLWNNAPAGAPTPSASPSASPTPDKAAQTVHGIPITVSSDLNIDNFAMTPPSDSRYTKLYAVISYSGDDDEAVTALFDVTAYDSDGAIIDRAPASIYLLPGQTSLLEILLSGEIADSVSLAVEQTLFDVEAPVMTGGLELDDLHGADSGYVEGDFTSTFSQASEYADLYFVGFVDGEIYAVCSDFLGIPANAPFTSGCYLDEAWNEELAGGGMLPADAEFDTFVALEIPY